MLNIQIIIAVVAALFIGVQRGDALKCYSCNSNSTCQKPTEITCDGTNANATVFFVSSLSNSLTPVYSKKFECFNYKDLSNNTLYKGCLYNEYHPCKSIKSPQNANATTYDCSDCSGSLCNPAGTFSASILTTVLALLGVTTMMSSVS